MVKVVEKFNEEANKIISEYDGDGIELIVNKQYELMLHILKKKNLYDYGVDNLMKNMMLSIFDEINEYIDMASDKSVEDKERTLESLFELVDALHFIVQLQFLAIIKNNNYLLTDLNKDEIKKNVITSTIQIFENLHKNSPLTESIKENIDIFKTYTKLMLKTSEVLSTVHWKHWKTYNNFDYDGLTNKNKQLYDLLLDVFEAVNQEGNSSEKILKYYVIKNIENFDRQQRGY